MASLAHICVEHLLAPPAGTLATITRLRLAPPPGQSQGIRRAPRNATASPETAAILRGKEGTMIRSISAVDPRVRDAVRLSLAAITHARTTLELLGDLTRVHPPVVAVLDDYREALAELLEGGRDHAA
jgi:hypothetical protein